MTLINFIFSFQIINTSNSLNSKIEICFIILLFFSMTQKLQRVLGNPFIRSNPFHHHQSFYSSINSSQPTSQSLKNDYNYLSAKENQQKQSIPNIKNSRNCSGGNNLKKTSNPFYRKNLISHQQVFDDNNLGSLEVRINKPSFLENLYQPEVENINILYKGLSHKTPSCSVKCISFQHKHTIERQSFQDKENKVSMSNNLLGKAVGNHLLSPRFQSIKCLDGKQCFNSPKMSNTNLKLSRRDFGSAQKQVKIHSRRSSPSRENSMDYRSQKQLALRGISPKQQREIDAQLPLKHHDNQNKQVFDDQFKKQVMIRGQKYYKHFIEIKKT